MDIEQGLEIQAQRFAVHDAAKAFVAELREEGATGIQRNWRSPNGYNRAISLLVSRQRWGWSLGARTFAGSWVGNWDKHLSSLGGVILC